jgi:hypothetical protein
MSSQRAPSEKWDASAGPLQTIVTQRRRSNTECIDRGEKLPVCRGISSLLLHRASKAESST